MRKCSAVIAAMACCALVPAAFADDGFVGDWTVKLERQGNVHVSTISIVEGDGGLTGSWNNKNGTNELVDVKITDGTLTFVRKMERQGKPFELSYEATIVDGKLLGKFVTPRGEREFTGVAVVPTFVGLWDVTFEYQGQSIDAKLDVVDKDGKLSGKWSSDLGEGPLKDVTIADGELTFGRDINMQGQEIALEYSAKIEHSKLVGKIVSPMGDLPFTGTMANKAEGGSSEGTEAERAVALLKQLDANEDGEITEDEAPEQMKPFFAAIDKNADGHLDATEMIVVIMFMDRQP